jgi:hypothetical protein
VDRRLPNPVPLLVLAFALLFDQGVIAGAVGIDSEDIAGPAVEERVEHELDVVFTPQLRIPLHGVADDAVGGAVITHDADVEGGNACGYADLGPLAGDGPFIGLYHCEVADGLCRVPERLIQEAVQFDLVGCPYLQERGHRLREVVPGRKSGKR